VSNKPNIDKYQTSGQSNLEFLSFFHYYIESWICDLVSK